MQALRVLPRRSLALLPGSSKQFGPPRRWETWESYRPKHKAAWREVFPSQNCTYPVATANNDLQRRLWRDTWPAQGVAAIPQGRVLDAQGWPVAEKDTLLIDLAIGHHQLEYSALLTKRCVLDPTISGKALNLGTCHAQENYCHFLLEALPRLELFFRSGLTFDLIDWITVPNFPGGVRETFFNALQLPRKKLLHLSERRQYAFEILYQPSFPGRESFVPPWVVDFYRKRVLQPLGIEQIKKRRLYASRRQRGIANDAELWTFLKSRGFERIEPMTWEENVLAFASAEVVIGPHGAGLSNVVFCPAGAHLIELMPGDRAFPYFYSAACAASVNYHAILTTPLVPPGQEYTRLPSDEPAAVDVAMVKEKLNLLSIT
ncbi:MAG: glycosyltransferase family 61 protein [Nibricoccus sp.]